MMHLLKSYFPNCPLVILGTEQHLLKTRDGVPVQMLHEQVCVVLSDISWGFLWRVR